MDPWHLKVKEAKNYCIITSMQKISSIHQFILDVQGQENRYVCFRSSGWRKKSQLGGWKKVFLQLLRLLSCFNPSLSIKNNCFLLIIFTTEGRIILWHGSITVLRSQYRAVFFKSSYASVECFVFSILLVLRV